MKTLHPQYLSEWRKKVASKLERLKRLYMKGCSSELLFHGQPTAVYRKCGKEQCKCTEGGGKRHGPYSIIRINREGKRRQITLKRNEMHFYEMAERYQEQVRNRRKIIELQKEVLSMLDELSGKRTLWDKAAYGKK